MNRVVVLLFPLSTSFPISSSLQPLLLPFFLIRYPRQPLSVTLNSPGLETRSARSSSIPQLAAPLPPCFPLPRTRRDKERCRGTSRSSCVLLPSSWAVLGGEESRRKSGGEVDSSENDERRAAGASPGLPGDATAPPTSRGLANLLFRAVQVRCRPLNSRG